MKIHRTLPALALSSIVLLSSCSDPSTPTVGEYITVQLRRDALGAGANLPIEPLTNSFNGATVNVNGELLALNKQWVVVKDGERMHWISRPSVLLLSQK
jgi:hypothetical protein